MAGDDKKGENEMKNTLMITAAVALAAATTSGADVRPAAKAPQVRVMTYNVRYSAGDRKSLDNNWKARRDDFARMVEQENPDVVGFQEVLPDQRKWLETRFPAYAFIGEGRDADRVHGEASPVAFRRDRFEAVTNGTFWLSETPDVPGSKSWGTAIQRICTYAVLKDKATGGTFSFANTHTDHKSEEAREKGMLLIIERMKDFGRGAPVVLVGDHNCLEYEKPAKAVSKLLTDAIYLSQTPPQGSWRTFNFWSWHEKELSIVEALKKPVEQRSIPGDKSDMKRIDYIYVSPGTTVLDYRTVSDTRPGTRLYPSDHFPSVATLVMAPSPSCADTLTLDVLPGESWFGGITSVGSAMPWTSETKNFSRDLRKSNYNNQSSPILLSDKGRWVWCDDPFSFTFDKGRLTVESSGKAPISTGTADGGTLRSAYLAMMKAHFPPVGKIPEEMLFSAPQYNTWIELNYHQNQKGVLEYAKRLVGAGLPPGVIMIDDTWQTGYGVWKFDAAAFDNPKAMVDELHAMGFKVSLWVCPFVSMDSREYRSIAGKGAFCAGADRTPAAVKWWNGKSAVLDLTSPVAVKWFSERLASLVREFGIDGFKFDAADVHFYSGSDMRLPKGCMPVDQCAAYAAFGTKYPLNEFRACWKNGGRPLAQRLNDKACNWDALRRLIPEMQAAGLQGHLFVCPDLIYGGLLGSFRPGVPIDQELFVRSTQVHALSPMMQFSASPRRVLDDAHFALVKEAVELRSKFVPRILALARESAKSGEPMLRSMEYAFPGNGYASVKDQFVLGDDMIVAPQTVKGAQTRTVLLPSGRWRADDGATFDGPCRIEVKTPLSRLPYFMAVTK